MYLPKKHEIEGVMLLVPRARAHYVLLVRPYAKSVLTASRLADRKTHLTCFSKKAGMRSLESPGTWNWESRYLSGCWLCRCGYGAQPSKHLRIATSVVLSLATLTAPVGRSDSSPSTHTIWVPAACSIPPLHGEKEGKHARLGNDCCVGSPYIDRYL
ncbi:hypothetical protein PpBr36_00521, partial [Pyricularia pennisetigena]|uniref:hypothetical protein n=1 Tax=Pyricularia pennisetigena TaxID=1578925 RepID=UPI00115044AE